jgi:transcriptional regulator with XRE-family HTH domain
VGVIFSRCDTVSMANTVVPLPKSQPKRHYIREWRKYRHLTQDRLAERIGKTHGAISQVERGITDYTQEMLEALADALNCEPGDLLLRDPTVEDALADLRAMLRHVSRLEQQRAVRIMRELLSGGDAGAEIVRQEDDNATVTVKPPGTARGRTVRGR